MTYENRKLDWKQKMANLSIEQRVEGAANWAVEALGETPMSDLAFKAFCEKIADAWLCNKEQVVRAAMDKRVALWGI